MSDNDISKYIDSRIQDPEKFQRLTRRGFIGSMVAGAAWRCRCFDPAVRGARGGSRTGTGSPRYPCWRCRAR